MMATEVTVVEKIVSDGRRLFSARSLFPLLLLPAVVLALPESARLGEHLGHAANLAIEWSSLFIALAGVLLRCVTVATAPDGTSSRDTRGLRAPSLNRTGMYSVVRHPLYLGNALMWIGVAATTRVWWLVALVGLSYALYTERIIAFEEAFLADAFGDTFRAWAERTPALIPQWNLWTPATGEFMWRRVASEHNGLLAVIAITFLLRRDNLLLSLLAVAIAVSAVAIVARRFPARDELALHLEDQDVK